jgi:hypothetical protein
VFRSPNPPTLCRAVRYRALANLTGSFRVGPTDDDEFLAVQPFRFAPQPAISWCLRRIDRLGDHALKTELAGVAEDKFAVAVSWVLN